MARGDPPAGLVRGESMPAQIPGRECVPVRSIRMLNQMPEAEKRAILRRLIPSVLLRDFGVDPIRLTDPQGRPAVRRAGSA